jgi:hypothetical protein
MLGIGVGTGVAMSAWRYTEGLRGSRPADGFDGDDVDRKEALKRQRRRPFQETIDQLGEGRGKLWLPCPSTSNKALIPSSRYIRSWLPRTEAGEAVAEIRS